MYDDSDLDAAVAAGTQPATAVQDLRRFVAARRADPPPPDRDRHFRYTATMADLMPTLGVLVLLAGVGLATAPVIGTWGSAITAAVAWLLSERFAPRRAGVPTTTLFLGFSFSVAIALTGAVFGGPTVATFDPQGGMLIAGGCALANWLYWRRFSLPVAVPAALLSAITIGDHLLMMVAPGAPSWFVTGWTVAAALAMFGAALWWDATDVYRQTIRSDVGFWIHLLAAFQLVSALFRGIWGKPIGPYWGGLWTVPQVSFGAGDLAGAYAITAIGACIALIVDRRAIAVMAMLFTLRLSLGATADAGGAVALALIINGGLTICLTLRWSALRRALVARLPALIRAQVPRGDPAFWYPRPIA